jgi:hypothetical protein
MEIPVMVMLNCPVADALAESVTRTVKVEVPPLVGVPEIKPAPLSESPEGKAPLEMLHAYGGTPPAALSVCVYATAT